MSGAEHAAAMVTRTEIIAMATSETTQPSECAEVRHVVGALVWTASMSAQSMEECSARCFVEEANGPKHHSTKQLFAGGPDTLSASFNMYSPRCFTDAIVRYKAPALMNSASSRLGSKSLHCNEMATSMRMMMV